VDIAEAERAHRVFMTGRAGGGSLSPMGGAAKQRNAQQTELET
jgi:hypothetical protein